MLFATIYRSLLTRLLAALIVVLVLSPYSEPFATIDGTDFSGAGAVDVDGVAAAKLKTSMNDALVAPLIVPVIVDVFTANRPLLSPLTLDSHRSQRSILRL
jgi:hypothetical protein